MPQILRLVYEANGPSISAVVDTIETLPDGRVGVVATNQPQAARHITLASLKDVDTKLYEDLTSVLARLEPIVRRKAEEDVSDPTRIRKEANRVAGARQELERRTEEANRSIDEALVQVKLLGIETAAARESFTTEMNQLISYTTAKKAEIEELEEQARLLRKSIAQAKQLEAPK